ncbi:MAG: LPS export ABC transporter periplasmic protein LptC [Desulfohalobiaceae bacterium]
MVKLGRLNRTRALLLWALLLVAGAVALVFWLGQEEPGQDILREIEVTVSVQGLELEHGANGKRAWRLTAPSSEYNQEEAVFYLQEPSLEFFSSQQEDPLVVQASQGRFDQDRQSASFTRGVQANYQDMVLQAEAMQYVQELGWIVFQGPISAWHPSMQVLGSQARFEVQEERVLFLGQVQVELINTGS